MNLIERIEDRLTNIKLGEEAVRFADERIEQARAELGKAEIQGRNRRLILIEDTLRCGVDLNELKAEIAHGGWLPQLAEFELPERTAQLWMRLARQYGADPVAGAEAILAAGGIKAVNTPQQEYSASELKYATDSDGCVFEDAEDSTELTQADSPPDGHSLASTEKQIADLDRLEADNRALREEQRKARQATKAEVAAMEEAEKQRQIEEGLDAIEENRILRADDTKAELVKQLDINKVLRLQNMTVTEQLQKANRRADWWRKTAYDHGYQSQPSII